MKTKNNVAAKTDPWGTPDSTRRRRENSASVVHSSIRDRFVFRKRRGSHPKSQPPGFLEEDTAQRSRQQEVSTSTVPKRLRESSFFEFLSQQGRPLTSTFVKFNRTGAQRV
ncbi:hypothetical protein J6590_084618 [Homalodisca vitripennis]|nr:hypothetical protein J6590_084618 [Homalodisca vitripennis]